MADNIVHTTEGHANVSGPTDQPTPETDAHISPFSSEFANEIVAAEFARQLERQRNELVLALREMVRCYATGGRAHATTDERIAASSKARTLLDRVEAK